MRKPVFFEVPGGTPAVRCDGCERWVYWIRTRKNKRMPIDCDVEGGYPPNSMERGRGVAHFATCPQAQRFRSASPEARSRVLRMRDHRRAQRTVATTNVGTLQLVVDRPRPQPGLFESTADLVAAAKLIALHSGVGESRILTFAEDAKRAAQTAASRTFATAINNQVREAAVALETFYGERW